MSYLNRVVTLVILSCAGFVTVSAQVETPPGPTAPKTAKVPPVAEKALENGLKVAVIQKTSSPIVTIQFMIDGGAERENAAKAGEADLTASMLTKGTATKTATQIAEAINSLGGTINSGAGWNSSFVSVTVTSDKFDQAMAILADVVLHPAFEQKEFDLLKTQTLDGLTYNLKQPSFLANYAASKYSFGEHPAGGTPASINAITIADLKSFYSSHFRANFATLICSGDVSLAKASAAAQKLFAEMTRSPEGMEQMARPEAAGNAKTLKRILVIDLPASGQAAVSYFKKIETGRKTPSYFPATVMNAVIGGGYSARLNYEIRVKRGLSYGAGSNIAWRFNAGNFGTRAQTKNESAAEVAELTLAEIKRLTDSNVASDELVPRKSTLNGGFGMSLETTRGLAGAVSELYSFGIPSSELNSFVSKVNGVSDAQIRDFAAKNLLGGDLIIAGDYSVFKDDLAKRFPNMPVEVIKADDLDLSKDDLHR